MSTLQERRERLATLGRPELLEEAIRLVEELERLRGAAADHGAEDIARDDLRRSREQAAERLRASGVPLPLVGDRR